MMRYYCLFQCNLDTMETTTIPEAMSNTGFDVNISATMDMVAVGINEESAKGFVFYGEVVAQPVILLFGLVTNIITLVILPKVKMTETFKTCLMALAVSDLCACVMGSTQQFVKGPYFRGESPFGYLSAGSIANFTLYFVHMMFMSVSGCLVVMIAIVRNISVLKPLKAKHWFTRSKTIRVCVAVFLANFVVYLPSGFAVTWMTCYKDVGPSCLRLNQTIGLANLETIVTAYLHFIAITYGPIIFVIYIACVISIWVTLKRSTKALATMASPRLARGNCRASQRRKTTGKITRMLLIILVLDMVCSLPNTAYGVTLVKNRTLAVEVYDAAAEMIYCFRPAYNFWVYLFSNPDFKRGVCDTWSSCFTSRRSPQANGTSSQNRSTSDSPL